jgi:hypothetical protein
MREIPPYPVLCTATDCGQPALYKIAARWSDGKIAELKTYALSCAGCLQSQLHAARNRQRHCILVPGETMDEAGIYERHSGSRDHQLTRRQDLE